MANIAKKRACSVQISHVPLCLYALLTSAALCLMHNEYTHSLTAIEPTAIVWMHKMYHIQYTRNVSCALYTEYMHTLHTVLILYRLSTHNILIPCQSLHCWKNREQLVPKASLQHIAFALNNEGPVSHIVCCVICIVGAGTRNHQLIFLGHTLSSVAPTVQCQANNLIYSYPHVFIYCISSFNTKYGIF